VLNKYLKSQKGFTLLELLVVIVVIGILALLVIPNLTSAPKKARDIQRKTDLRAIQKALEEYFVSNSAYPTVSGTAGTNAQYLTLTPLTSGNPPILKSLPTDPLNTGVYVYSYSSATPFSSYSVKACLENGADVGQYTATDATCTGATRSFTLVNNN
jgi:general secretion pathway protein G